MFEYVALYISLVSTIGSHLGCAYPSTREGQPQCIVEWYPKDGRPLYGVTQKMAGPCQAFHVECSHGITLPLNVPEGLGFPGKVIQGCPDDHNFAVPCCLPDIKCGVNLAGRCMNRNKECKDGNWFSDERCPEGPWPCCDPSYATTGINGEDTQMVASKGDSTFEETGGTMAAAGNDRVFIAPEMYHPFSWDDLQRSKPSFQFQPVPVISEPHDKLLDTSFQDLE